MYQDMPPEGDDIPLTYTTQKALEENQYLKNTYPRIHVPTVPVMVACTSFSTSGGSDAYTDLIQ